MSDAVVIGAGHNGLVAANILADAGWEVDVLEAASEPGGAVRTAELTLPGFHHDVFSAFYPLAVASPVIRELGLEHHGLEWRRAPVTVAHPTLDGTCPVLSTDLDETVRSLDAEARGDGEAWRRLYERWCELEEALLDALMTPFPPLVDGVRLAGRAGLRTLPELLRFLLLPVRRLAEEEFAGRGAGLLFGGNAMHTDLGVDAVGSGAFGWLLCGLGQHHGYPVPRGGSQRLVDALTERLRSRGGRLHLDTRASAVVVRRGQAVAVRTADGDHLDARHAVVAAIDAPQLLAELVDGDDQPPSLRAQLRRYQHDLATFKVDWALDDPIPWVAEDARRAGTLHLGDSLDELTGHTTQLAAGLLPDHPYAVVGQMNVADPDRSPPGTETAWAYTTLPQHVRGDAGGALSGRWEQGEAEAFAERLEERIEARAPGFAERIIGRHILTPNDMEARNPSLVGGQRNGGTSQLYQQLIFRPTPGLGRPEMPIGHLYLASASAHPGGGVHGGPGANAARAALHTHRARRVAVAAGLGAAGWTMIRRARRGVPRGRQ